MKIHLSNSAGRSATVIARPLSSATKTRLLTPGHMAVERRRVVKSTGEFDMNDEPDIEQLGRYINNAETAYVDPDGALVYNYTEKRQHVSLDGEVTEVARTEPNICTDVPLKWTGKFIGIEDAVRRFLFSRQVQICHNDPLSYDYLMGMAVELYEKQSLMLITAGKERLVFTRGGIPYVGMLHGDIERNGADGSTSMVNVATGPSNESFQWR